MEDHFGKDSNNLGTLLPAFPPKVTLGTCLGSTLLAHPNQSSRVLSSRPRDVPAVDRCPTSSSGDEDLHYIQQDVELHAVPIVSRTIGNYYLPTG